MSTSCEMCDQPLAEGATVYRDTEPHYYGDPPKRLRTSRFCSERCVREWDAPPEPEGVECEHCGERVDAALLCEVDDSDHSVGYRSVVVMCPKCVTARRVGPSFKVAKPEYAGTLDRPIRLAPGDDDDAEVDAGLLADAQDAGLRVTPRGGDDDGTGSVD